MVRIVLVTWLILFCGLHKVLGVESKTNINGRDFASGFIEIDANSKYFYTLVSKAESSNKRILLWMNGGLGSSSFLGYFTSIGHSIYTKDLKLEENPYAFDNMGDVLVLDQPAGVGLNPRIEVAKMPQTFEEVSRYLLIFLKKFFKQNPKYTELYLTGESMGGNIYARLSSLMIEDEEMQNKLRGIFLVSPWLNAPNQYGTMAKYLFYKNKISRKEFINYSLEVDECAIRLSMSAIDSSTNKICREIVDKLVEAGGSFYKYNINFPVEDNPYLLMSRSIKDLFRSGSVKEILGYTGETSKFSMFSTSISQLYEFQYLRDALPILKETLEKKKIPLVVITGGLDFICNELAASLWLKDLGAFPKKTTDYEGYSLTETTMENVQHAVFPDAGHLACWHLPSVCFDLLNRLIERSDKLLDS